MNYGMVILGFAIFLVGFLIGGECFNKKKSKAKTRFERIKQKSTEEFVELLEDVEDVFEGACFAKYCEFFDKEPCGGKCQAAIVKYLNEEGDL